MVTKFKMKEANMAVKNEEKLFEFTPKGLKEINSIIMVSKNPAVREADIKNVVQILDENGMNDMSCTMNKFVEIFDQKGLSGFIM